MEYSFMRVQFHHIDTYNALAKKYRQHVGGTLTHARDDIAKLCGYRNSKDLQYTPRSAYPTHNIAWTYDHIACIIPQLHHPYPIETLQAFLQRYASWPHPIHTLNNNPSLKHMIDAFTIGSIIITGPTNSGKSTTLHTIAQYLRAQHRSHTYIGQKDIFVLPYNLHIPLVEYIPHRRNKSHPHPNAPIRLTTMHHTNDIQALRTRINTHELPMPWLHIHHDPHTRVPSIQYIPT